MGADITVTAGSLVASFRIPRPFPSSLSLSLDTSSSLDSCITVHSFVYNPLPSTRRNACTRFRTRPPKIYEKILSFFEISFRSFSRRKFRRLFFLSGSDVYIINSGREMIFESRSLSRGKLPRDSLNSIPFHYRSFRDSTARNIFYLFARRKGNFSFFRNWKIVTLILSDISDISERYTRLAKERKSSFVTRAFRFLSIPPFELFSLYILSLFPCDRTEIR